MENIEIWKDIEGYEGIYQISSLGRCKSLDRTLLCSNRIVNLKSKILKHSYGGNGYPSVNLWNLKKYKTFNIHRLLAIYFIENPENKKCINHINANKKDFSLDNLEWCMHKENMHHANSLGLMKNRNAKSGKNHHASVSLSQYSKEHVFINEFDSITEAQNKTGLDRALIRKYIKNPNSKKSEFIWKRTM